MEHLSTFQREYLWELEIPRKQVLALAEAIPEEAFDWRPAEDARTFAAVLVHLAAGNLMLLYRAGGRSPEVMKLYGRLRGEGMERWLSMVHWSCSMEKMLTSKEAILDLLERSFEAVRSAFAATSAEDLEMPRELFGEITTCRQLYLRILSHADEHMGQLIGYTRVMGFLVPWPDPVKVMEENFAKTAMAS